MNRRFFGLCAGVAGCAFALQVPAAAIAQSQETILHSFGTGADGNGPGGSLIDVKGTLYGTTASGGSHDKGTVFSLDLNTGAETVVYSFMGGADGGWANANLIDVKGKLYGTTFYGGGGADCINSGGCGTVFALDPATGAETVLYSFCSQQSCADGEFPQAGLIDVRGTLYGAAYEGGPNGHGMVFAVDPQTGAETLVYSFKGGADGSGPVSGLLDVKGTLYGTTFGGGTAGVGTVYSVDPATGAEQVVYAFCRQQNCADGESPYRGLIDVKGMLYGTTYGGGTDGKGTVYSLDPATGTETVLHSFCNQIFCKDGEFPESTLIDVNGVLYGTTTTGGTRTCRGEAGGCGAVFSIDPASGTETLVYSFLRHGDGQQPLAGLLDVKGMLYGTTVWGGANDKGTVFALTNP